MINLAIERYVEEELAFIEDCRLAADGALDPTAARVPHAAVRAWLSAWGTPAEADAATALGQIEAELADDPGRPATP